MNGGSKVEARNEHGGDVMSRKKYSTFYSVCHKYRRALKFLCYTRFLKNDTDN